MSEPYRGRRIATPGNRPNPPAPPADPRPARGPSGRLGWIVGLIAVVVTVAGLLVAGNSPLPTGVTTASLVATALSRDFSCSSGLPGAQMLAGGVGAAGTNAGVSSGGKQATGRPQPIGHGPVFVSADPKAATGAYATRWATGKGFLAASACPTPRSDWWFVGAGGSLTHDSVLQIDNPRAGDAEVTVTVFGPAGPVQAPGLAAVPVPSHGSVRLDLGKVAPAVGDLGVHIVATRGLVSASASQTWRPNAASPKALGWVADQPTAATSATLLGLAPKAAGATLLVANPSNSEAVVNLKLVGTSGTFLATGMPASVRVPPQTVLPFDLSGALKGNPAAVRLTSQVPVVATVRTTLGTDETTAGTGEPLGPSSVVGLPRGIPATLVLVSTGKAGTAKVIAYAPNGTSLGARQVSVPARSAANLAIGGGGWARASVLRIEGAGQLLGSVVAGRSTQVATIGLAPTANDARVPAVVPSW